METVFDMASINYPYGVLHDQKLKSVSNEDNKFIFTFDIEVFDDYDEEIHRGLEQKLDAMVRHELYVKYKTAPTAEEREQARQEYLDKRGIFPDFRW